MRLRHYLVVFIALLFVFGCSKGEVAPKSETHPSSALVDSANVLLTNEALLELIYSQGGEVINMGDTTSIVIIADFLFEPTETSLKTNDGINENAPLLDNVALLLNQFGRGLVKVAVGTDNAGGPRYSEKITRARSERVASYLSKRTLKPLHFYAVAYGEDNLLTDNRTVLKSQLNRVVEITINPNLNPDNPKVVRKFLNGQQAWQYWGLPY